ncbi:hypothetical protein [Methylobacterium sp. Leaf88]|jgi:hypothetical protein|uniref:hypothetical protein n=1 Tax=Methylobacterium sp. Leaf88 TaxID=1736244 RepID=UPI0006F5D876|nr:hypothetical protein [Methylobacterium sp. Leaf88]KQO65696.1 hypothetical protein ASF20_07385 [Methylobacterium sp. Leaf88]
MRVVPVAALVLSIMMGGDASAASCSSAFGMASSADSDAFKADPFSILKGDAKGGALARSTRELVLANTDFADVILSLGVAANGDQRAAMGAGLGQATLACARTQPELAQQLQLALLSRGSPELTEAFKAVVGEIPTTAVSIPAAASSPLGGGEASLIGGGQNSVPQGVVQAAGGGTGFAIRLVSVAPTARAPSFFSPIGSIPTGGPSGGGSTSGGSSPAPVATVPGPVAGAGMPALVIMVLSALAFLRHRVRSRAA